MQFLRPPTHFDLSNARIGQFKDRLSQLGNQCSPRLKLWACGLRNEQSSEAQVRISHLSLANELGGRGIRVNTVHPTAVDTRLIHNDFTYRLFRPDLESPGREDVVELFRSYHSLPIPWIESSDVSEAVAFLACDASRYITGITMTVDAGLSAR